MVCHPLFHILMKKASAQQPSNTQIFPAALRYVYTIAADPNKELLHTNDSYTLL